MSKKVQIDTRIAIQMVQLIAIALTLQLLYPLTVLPELNALVIQKMHDAGIRKIGELPFSRIRK